MAGFAVRLHGRGRAQAGASLLRADLHVGLAVGALIMVVAGITAYEHLALGWHFAREVAPEQSPWHWWRAILTAATSLMAVAAIAAAAPSNRRAPVSRGGFVLAALVLGASLVLVALLVASPRAYRDVGAEDGFVEWVGAGGLFAGSLFCAMWLRRLANTPGARDWLHLLAAGGFAALFFVMGMEEISWGQRLVGFATPESIAAENWQGEFNLHNMQTDLAEFALYTGTGLFLVILPLVRDRLRHWRIVARFAPLIPDRSVALVSAPMLAFDYARLNLLPIQAVLFGGLGACLVLAWSAAGEGRRRDAAAFALVSAFIVVGQSVHLLLGHTMIEIFDPSEYRETILAIGIGWYGWRQWRSASVR